jgi:hypothetical protein
MEAPLSRLLILSWFVNKHSRHRQFFFLVGRHPSRLHKGIWQSTTKTPAMQVKSLRSRHKNEQMNVVILGEHEAVCDSWRSCIFTRTIGLQSPTRYHPWTIIVPGLHKWHARSNIFIWDKTIREWQLIIPHNQQPDRQQLTTERPTSLEKWVNKWQMMSFIPPEMHSYKDLAK